MSKEETLKLTGTVLEVLPSATFRVELETAQTVLGYISGRMRKNSIKVLAGDTVEIEFSPYDLLRGRVTRRL